MFSGYTDIWQLMRREPGWAFRLLRRPTRFWAVLRGEMSIAILPDDLGGE